MFSLVVDLETLLAGEVSALCFVRKKCSVVWFWELWNDVLLSPHSIGADHELPLKLDKPAVRLERGEGLRRGVRSYAQCSCNVLAKF